MEAYEILDLKRCTKLLFSDNIFDEFFVQETEILTYNRFSIDGRIQKSYFDTQDTGEIAKFSKWRDIKPICFDLIKGKRLPLSFKIVLKYPDIDMGLDDASRKILNNESYDFFINIKYEEKKLSFISAASMKKFDMDKNIISEWDRYIRDFLKKNEVAINRE